MKKVYFRTYKDTKYVYSAESRHRLPNGKLSKDIRTQYGKILDDVFIPNNTYLALTKKEKKQLGIETAPDENIVEKALRKQSSMEDKKQSQIISTRRFYGSVYLLEQAAEKSGALEILKNSFPTCYKKILSICFFFILERNSPLYRFDIWSRFHKHPYGLNISSSSSSKFLDSITENDIDYFLSKFSRYSGENTITAIDSTSISSYSQLLHMAKRGINKDHDILDQLNVLVGFGAETHLPIYIKRLLGNISDITTIENLIADFDSYGIKNSTFFLDRGYYSNKNIGLLLEKKYKFLCIIKGKPVFIKNVFDDVANIESPLYYIREYKLYATTRKYTFQYKNGDTNRGKTVYLTKSYDPTRAKEAKENFSIKIDKLKEELATKQTTNSKSIYNKYVFGQKLFHKSITIFPTFHHENSSFSSHYFFHIRYIIN